MLARNKIAIVVVGIGIAVVTAYQVGTSDAVVTRRLRAELAKYVSAPCTFESASFTFLHGLEVRGLTILDPADPLGPPLLVAEQSRINYVLDVAGAGPHVTRIDIERPRVRVERAADGSFPARRAFSIPSPEGPSPPKPRVHLSGGEVTFADRTILREPLVLHDIDLDIAPAGKATDWARAALHLRAVSDVLGPVTVEAVVGSTGTSATVTLDLTRTRIEPSLPGRFAGDLGRRIAELAPTGELTAHVTARLEDGKDFDADAKVEIRGVSLSVAIPEADATQAPPKAIAVTGLSGHLRYADDRVEAHDLAFEALGARFRIDATVAAVTQPAPTIDAKVDIAGLALSAETHAFLPSAVRAILETYEVTGDVAATATLRGALSAPAVTAEATVAHGRARYHGWIHEDGKRRGFPWPTEDVEGKVTFDGGTIRVGATARHGPARVRADVVVLQPPSGDVIPEVLVVAQDVPLDDELRRSFADGGESVFGQWGPSGTAKTVTVHVHRAPGVEHHDMIDVTVECDGRAAFLPRIVPVALRNVTGRVEILEPPVDGRLSSLVRLTEVTAQADGFTIRVSGEVRDVAGRHGEDLVVTVDSPDAGGGPRTAALAAADSTIAPGVKDAIRKLGPSGPIHLVAHLVQPVGEARRDTVDVELLGAAVTGWDDIPLAARVLTGRAHIEDDALTLTDVAGWFVMGDFAPAFTAHGRLLGLSGTPQFDIHVESPEIPLGEALRRALGPLAKKAEAFWKEVDPAPGAHASLVLDLRPDADPTPFEVTLDHIHGTMRPVGLELDCDEGTFHFDGRRAEMRGLDAAIGSASVRVDSADVDVATGRVAVRAGIRGLHFPEDLAGPLSAATVAKIVETAPGRTMHALDVVLSYDPELRALEVAGTVSIRPRTRRALRDPGLSPEGILDISRLVFYMPADAPAFFQGEANAEELSLRVGLAVDRFKGPLQVSGTLGDPAAFEVRTTDATLRVQDFPLTGAAGVVAMKQRGMHVDLKADFVGGDLVAVVNPGDRPGAYRGHMTIEDADLETFLRLTAPPGQEVSTGKVFVGVTFTNETGVSADLRGTGKVEVRDGQLAPSPIISSIVSVIPSVLVARPMLSEAQMKFEIAGDWLDVRDLWMKGTGGALEDGRGKIGLTSGILDLSVQPRFDVPVPVLEALFNFFQARVIPRFHVGGTIRNPVSQPEFTTIGKTDRRREPQPQGDVEAPARDPW